MPQQYDPLSQEDDSHLVDADQDDVDSPRAGLLPRPAIYYGEGPFNAPSSDEEDEVEEVEKVGGGMGPLNRAEHGSRLVDSGLYVGGRKVSTSAATVVAAARGGAHEVARVTE
jgi:dipeptidyl aminopeptidase